MGPYTDDYRQTPMNFGRPGGRPPMQGGRPPMSGGRPPMPNNRVGFLGPFLLGGLTGGLVAPFFYGGYRPYPQYPINYYPPYYRPY